VGVMRAMLLRIGKIIVAVFAMAAATTVTYLLLSYVFLRIHAHAPSLFVLAVLVALGAGLYAAVFAIKRLSRFSN
jgi:hypothetical protein